jgi:hypothetical protein
LSKTLVGAPLDLNALSELTGLKNSGTRVRYMFEDRYRRHDNGKEFRYSALSFTFLPRKRK